MGGAGGTVLAPQPGYSTTSAATSTANASDSAHSAVSGRLRASEGRSRFCTIVTLSPAFSATRDCVSSAAARGARSRRAKPGRRSAYRSSCALAIARTVGTASHSNTNYVWGNSVCASARHLADRPNVKVQSREHLNSTSWYLADYATATWTPTPPCHTSLAAACIAMGALAAAGCGGSPVAAGTLTLTGYVAEVADGTCNGGTDSNGDLQL